MGSMAAAAEKLHAVCVPYPGQGHLNPMMKLATELHARGFHVTFVNTEYNHRRLMKSRGTAAVDGFEDFRFRTIPDGLPPPDHGGTHATPSLCEASTNFFLAPFKELLVDLNSAADSPPISCIVSDGVMSFTLDAAEEIGVPVALFWTTSACGFMGYLQYRELIRRGVHFKDKGDFPSRNIDMPVEGISGMPRMRLRDFPSFIWRNDKEEFMNKFVLRETERASRASAIILNTFESLEGEVLEAMESILPPVYTVGPLSLVSRENERMGSNMWKEDASCVDWLDGREPDSVLYVSFGSNTVVSKEQLVEFAWGLAQSKKDFLWIVRPDLVKGDSAVLPEEFLEETMERGKLASWCPQEEVLAHSAVGGFLTHCGWNSTLESISAGVPMICWPFFAEQQTNCRHVCAEWGIGMEIDGDLKGEKVRDLIEDLMEREKGKEMRRRAGEWKEKALDAAKPGGSSTKNLEDLVRILQIRS